MKGTGEYDENRITCCITELLSQGIERGARCLTLGLHAAGDREKSAAGIAWFVLKDFDGHMVWDCIMHPLLVPMAMWHERSTVL